MPRKSDYKKALALSSRDIAGMSTEELKSSVKTMNAEANRRLKALEREGLSTFSSAYSQRKKGDKAARFTTRKIYERDRLLAAYLKAKSFLSSASSTVEGVQNAQLKMEGIYRAAFGIDLVRGTWTSKSGNVHSIYRKGTKELRKDILKRLSRFWEKYNQYKELAQMKGVYTYEEGGTNLEDMMEFYDLVYSKGKTATNSMERILNRMYEEAHQGDNWEEGLPPADVPTRAAKRGGKGGAKQAKQPKKYGKTKKTNGIKERFERIKIF